MDSLEELPKTTFLNINIELNSTTTPSINWYLGRTITIENLPLDIFPYLWCCTTTEQMMHAKRSHAKLFKTCLDFIMSYDLTLYFPHHMFVCAIHCLNMSYIKFELEIFLEQIVQSQNLKKKVQRFYFTLG